MRPRFDYFVILADMRTGSNFLEANLNDFPGINCHGELFNPHFIGGPKAADFDGITMQQRLSDPQALLERIKSYPDGLHGFRFFSDHDPRVLPTCLSDRRCAKIILTRNPVDSYVSREIARQTDQWRLGDMRRARSAKITFEPEQFAEHLARQQGFQAKLHRALQTSGQTAFHIDYEDISDIDIVNGLARFLGVSDAKKKISGETKKQNPQSLEEKVLNFQQMQDALASTDPFGLNRVPNFEPRRGAVIPRYIAPARTPLLFMPISSGPTDIVTRWLADIDGGADQTLLRDFSQKKLRQWKRQSKGHQSFTVVRHPALRLHDAFVRHILMPGPAAYHEIREVLRTGYDLPIPRDMEGATYDAAAHRAAFIAFAGFVRGNLGGQTSIRVDRAWASQSEILRGMGQFALPNHIFTEDRLQGDLDYLADNVGVASPKLGVPVAMSPFELHEIYDPTVEAATRAAYQRDYMMFGFGPWQP
jgi:hypothetical protein